MTEQDFKSEEFIELVNKAAYTVYKKYYKTYKTIANDLLTDSLIYVLEHKDELRNFSLKENEHELFYKIFKFSVCAMQIKTKAIKENVMSDKDPFFETSLASPGSIYDNLEFDNLLKQLKMFLKSYDIQKRVIVLAMLKKEDLRTISKTNKISLINISKVIQEFREEFSNYLITIGYITNPNDLYNKNLKSNREKVEERKKLKKQASSLIFETYQRDLLIYKLIRDNKLLNKGAKVLGMSEQDLEKCCYHSNNSKKILFLYQIQKLRNAFFNNYSLSDLAGVSYV